MAADDPVRNATSGHGRSGDSGVDNQSKQRPRTKAEIRQEHIDQTVAGYPLLGDYLRPEDDEPTHFTKVVHYVYPHGDGWGIECTVCDYVAAPFRSFEEADRLATVHEDDVRTRASTEVAS